MRAGDLNNLRREVGNFRLAAHARDKRARKRQEREDRDEGHLAAIRLLPCSVCERTAPRDAIHAHHLRHGPHARRGMGKKSSDYACVPLCFEHHDVVHRYGARKEHEWFLEHGYRSILAVAEAYKHQRGDQGRLMRISLAHKLAASRILLERRK